MQPALPKYDIGVLVARFQVHELHDAHRDLIQHVVDNHDKVVIFLGCSPLPASSNNPLDFQSRKQMIEAAFPDANLIVLYQNDHPHDDEWSKKLDAQINSVRIGRQSVVLYGGRDSFIAHYTGKFPTQELMQSTFLSGTEVRKQIARSSTRNSPEFRAGVIWASQARFPTAYQCVDVAILSEDGTQVLLGRKSTDKLLRFPGGFSDPSSESLEEDAKREAMEETGVEVADLTYLGSLRVEDWRYRSEPDCIKTALFTAKYIHGRPTPSDDLDAEVRWVEFTRLTPQMVVPQHRPLLELLRTSLYNAHKKGA